LADGEISQDLLVDVLGKEQGALLMAGRTKAPSAATIRQQKVFAAGGAPQAGEAAA
jgi:hypothetical protein